MVVFKPTYDILTCRLQKSATGGVSVCDIEFLPRPTSITFKEPEREVCFNIKDMRKVQEPNGRLMIIRLYKHQLYACIIEVLSYIVPEKKLYCRKADGYDYINNWGFVQWSYEDFLKHYEQKSEVKMNNGIFGCGCCEPDSSAAIDRYTFALKLIDKYQGSGIYDSYKPTIVARKKQMVEERIEKVQALRDAMLRLETAYKVPVISRVIINDPSVIVFWHDGSKTVSKCKDGETFDPEVGLAMAISRKYYEILDSPYPRAAFKNEIKSADNYSKKTKDKKAAKKKTD